MLMQSGKLFFTLLLSIAVFACGEKTESGTRQVQLIKKVCSVDTGDGNFEITELDSHPEPIEGSMLWLKSISNGVNTLNGSTASGKYRCQFFIDAFGKVRKIEIEPNDKLGIDLVEILRKESEEGFTPAIFMMRPVSSRLDVYLLIN